jgi:hypothetical protein
MVAGKKKRRKRPESKVEPEVRRVMKEKNLRREEAVNRKVWRKVTASQ